MPKYPNEHKNTNNFPTKQESERLIDIFSRDEISATLGLDNLHITDVVRKDNVVYIYAQAEGGDADCPFK